ncbi:MAG: O-antigen ligase family protein [Firmicutes bacterium]|nr:O-antigen ligase family protein [Bacillota bacterium]
MIVPDFEPRASGFAAVLRQVLEPAGLILLAAALVAGPLYYPYLYYHQYWYVAAEAGACLAGAAAVLHALARAGRRRSPPAFMTAPLELTPAAAWRPAAEARRAAAWVPAGVFGGYAAYATWTFANSFRGLWPAKAWSEWAFIIACGLAAFAAYRFSGGPGRAGWTLLLCAAGPVAVAWVGLEQYAALHDWSTREITRIWSTTGNANTLSGYLAASLPVAAAMACARRGWRRWVWAAAAVVLATAILLSYTRGGWYAVLAALVLLALWVDRRLLLWLAVYVVAANAVFPGVLSRAASGLNPEEVGTFQQRLQLWATAYYMWRDHPWVGVGTGDYVPLTPEYVARHPEIDRGLRNREPHNSYLKTLAEQGLFGLVLLLGPLVLWWRALLFAWRQARPGPRRALLGGLAAGSLAVAVHCLSNSVLHDYRSALGFWPYVGLGLRLIVDPAAMEADDAFPL